MLNRISTNVEHIIAKIDNDFNPDNSDWVSRVGAWCIDAMSQLKVLSTERKRRTIKVYDKIAIFPCSINEQGLRVYNKNGCEIKLMTNKCERCNVSSTGDKEYKDLSNTIGVINNNNSNITGNVFIESVNDNDIKNRYNVKEIAVTNEQQNYVIIDNNKIELNFNASEIIVESEEVKTYYSDYFNCDLPVIPNNGLLLEAIGCYCLYKMLCRGYKHTVFNLTVNNPGINPYLGWKELSSRAKASVIIDAQGNIRDSGAWRSMFYNFTFSK